MENKMFDNIGRRIKNLAISFFIIEIFATIIGCFIFLFSAEDVSAFPIAFLIIVGGIGAAYFLSTLLYGFGEMIDKLCDIERNTRGGERKSETQAKADDERLRKLENLRAQGLITEEEYKQAITKKNKGDHYGSSNKSTQVKL